MTKFKIDSLWWITILLFCVSIVSGTSAFVLLGDKFIDALYKSMQLLVLQSSTDFSSPRSFLLEISRWSAVLGVGWTVLVTIWTYFHTRIQLLFTSRHIVIIGLGSKGKKIADEYLNRGTRKVSILHKLRYQVVIIEHDDSNETLAECESKGAGIVVGSGVDIIVLKKAKIEKAAKIIVASSSDENNASIVTTIYQISQKRGFQPIERKRSDKTQCFIHLNSLYAQNIIRAHAMYRKPHDWLDLRIVNIYEMAARDIALTLLKSDKLSGPINVAIFGYGFIARHLIAHLAQYFSTPDGERPHVTIYSFFPEMDTIDLNNEYYDLKAFIDVDFHKIEPRYKNTSSIIGSLKKESYNAIFFVSEDGVIHYPFISILDKELGHGTIHIVIDRIDGIAQALEGIELEGEEKVEIPPFNIFKNVWSLANIENHSTEALARNIHKDRTSDMKGQRWEDVKTQKKDDRRFYAQFILHHPELSEIDELNMKALTKAARREHWNWLANKTIHGWSLGDKNSTYQDRNLKTWRYLDKIIREEHIKNMSAAIRILKSSSVIRSL